VASPGVARVRLHSFSTAVIRIESGVYGLLVPPGDPHRLAEALSFLLNDAPTRVRFGRAAQARAVRTFTVEQQVSSTERMYLELCGAPSAQDNGQISSDVLSPREEWSSSPTPWVPEVITGNVPVMRVLAHQSN